MSYRTMKLELMSFVPELNAVQAGLRVNRSYQHLLALHPWSFIKGDTLVHLYAPITAGTTTATYGSDAVTGIGTAWTALNTVGRFLKMSSSFVFYKIIGFTVPQTLTLETTFGEPSLVSNGYTIFQNIYSKPTDCADILGLRYNYNLPSVTKNGLDTMDPNRDSTGEPNYWLNRTDGTFEIWPIPDQNYTLRMWYNRSFPDMLAETDLPVIPQGVILAHARMESCLQLATSPGIDPKVATHYLALYTMMAQDPGPTGFKSLWQAAVEEDVRKLSLPHTVIAIGPDYPYNNDYLMRHDVGDPRRP